MLALSTAFVVAALSSGVVANLRADFIPQTFEARSVRPAGGFALALNSQESCPTDSPPCGATWCCPASLTCNPTGSSDIAEVCCPGEIECISAFQATPFCADDSWSLWNATLDTVDDAGYFCCLPGQSGLQDGTCVSSDQISSPTQLAAQLGAGSSGTIAPTSATSARSSSASSSASARSTSTTESGTKSSSASSSEASSASSKSSESSATSGGRGSSTATTAATTGKETSSGSGSTATSSAASSSSSPAAATGSGERSTKTYGAGLLGCVMVIAFAVGLF